VSKPLRKSVADWIVQLLTATEAARAPAGKRGARKAAKRRRKNRARRSKL
jgi:hypothetical protein